MKTSYAAILLALSTTAAFAQKTGDTVTPETLGKIEWVRGEAPKAWEPGKVYVLECWATWCGPCIAAIPHVDALYDKYHEKGLNVIGVNVWEDGKDKVEKFLKDKGDGMSYPVAYTGKGGAFETEWLKPADVKGIPHAFIVKDGKVVMTTHPAQLTEETIEGLLAGGDAQEKVLNEIKVKQENQQKMSAALQAFQAASAAKDVAAMEKAKEELGALDPKSPYASMMELDLNLAKGEWDKAESQLGSLQGNPVAMAMVSKAATAALKDDAPAGFRKTVATQLSDVLGQQKQPFLMPTLAKLQWKLGEKEAAVTTSKQALEDARAVAAKSPTYPVLPFERFSAALEKGEMPSDEDFNNWMKEARTAAAGAAAGGGAVPAKKVETGKE
ncbi:TlpA disulfide reductase family protein [Haloferula sp. BvORR071]|uniref:TlpA disulfide reductase family protein n=1 Tax=Haloferula sp. BvORR071 TaxID=1396141 RepID=UPI002240F64B|nr:TlpA disulfide reductase family protein [Haloferula sp. BvORR071]